MKTSNLFNIITLSAALFFAILPTANAAPVNINVASAEEISKNLNGIGMIKAKAVVDYRTENGKFTDLQSVTLVKGVGQKTVDKNENDILF